MKFESFPKIKIINKPSSDERIDILPSQGNLYKVNLHAHSTCSDGKFTPEELKKIYKSKGYNAVAFTDHRNCIPHPELNDDSFVALTGMELDFNHEDETGLIDHTVHINAIADDPLCSFTVQHLELTDEAVNQNIKTLKSMGCYVIINHPVWSNMSTEDLLRYKGMDAVEVFNSVAVWFNNYSDDSSYYEHYLRAGGRPLLPVAADDCHRAWEDHTPLDAEYGRGWCMIKAPELSYCSIMEGLRQKAAYATTGPEFKNLWIEGNQLHVECSPVSSVFVHGKYIIYRSHEIKKENSITETVLNIEGYRNSSPYIWVQLRDNEGHSAWSVPYYF